jgi:hypothetical protein
VDDKGNVYIADAGGNRIRRIDPRGVINSVGQILKLQTPKTINVVK